jgi:hypothetical protein
MTSSSQTLVSRVGAAAAPINGTALATIIASDTPHTRDAIAAALTDAGFSVSPATKYAPDTLLTRDAIAAALNDAGFPISPATLATKATRGGGPPYRRFGRKPLYEWGTALEWARSRLSAPIPNTSAA